MSDAASPSPLPSPSPLSLSWTGAVDAPLRLIETRVKRDWIDEFDHVNIAHYLTICDQANWAFWNWLNAPESTMDARDGSEYIIVENHVHYIEELPLDAEIYITTQLLGVDDKRFVLFHHVYKAATQALSATNEVKFLGFNLKRRGVEAWRPMVRARLDAVAAAHARLDTPPQAGLGIALKRR